jgi:hypothetical protein
MRRIAALPVLALALAACQSSMPHPGRLESLQAADPCLAGALDAAQLASFGDYLRRELARRSADVAAFDKGIPRNCPLGELQYYLAVAAQL